MLTIITGIVLAILGVALIVGGVGLWLPAARLILHQGRRRGTGVCAEVRKSPGYAALTRPAV